MNNNLKELVGIEVTDDIDLVRKKLSKVLTSGTLNNAAFYELAILCYRLSEFKLAKEAIKRFSLPGTAKLPDLLNYLAFLTELDEFPFVEKRLASLCVHYQLAPIFHMHGTVLSQMGKLDQAKTQLLKAFNIEARGETLLSIVALLSDEELIEYAIAAPTVSYGDISDVCFHAALSKIYQVKGDFKRSIDYAEKSHSLHARMMENQQEENIDSIIDRLPSNNAIQQAKSQINSASSTASKMQPVFLISLPRTGSTLLESLMNRHSDITAVGEISLLSNIIGNEATQEAFKTARKNRYLTHVSERFKHAKIIFDKSLSNLYVLPELLLAFPNAKFIFLHRQFENMAWSCFQTHFSQGLRWTDDKLKIRQRYKLFNDVSAHIANLQVDSICIAYEDLVSDSALVIDKLQAFLQLERQDLLNKQSNDIVKTASVSQVRKDIYASSLTLPEELQQFIVQVPAD